MGRVCPPGGKTSYAAVLVLASACNTIVGVVVTPKRPTVTVTTKAGANGSISPNNRAVDEGTGADFNIVADPLHAIHTVAGCAGSLTGTTYTTGDLTADCTIRATFRPLRVNVTTTATPLGTIAPLTTSLDWGGQTIFVITPQTGYTIDEVNGCQGVLSGTTFTTAKLQADCELTASFRLLSFAVRAEAVGEGGVTPGTATVEWGSTASFTLEALVNNSLYRVSGCGGTLAGDTYTTGPITGDCLLTAEFTPLLPQVTALYPGFADWNDYVKNDGASAITATGTATDGTETGGYEAVVHAGALRIVAVAMRESCAKLSAADALGAFEWICDDSGTTPRMISTGLSANASLSDLLDFTAGTWRANRVTVHHGGEVSGQTEWAPWWGNPVVVDNDGSDGSDMVAGEVRLVNIASTAAYILGQDRVALVVDPALVLSGAASPTSGPVVTGAARRHLWLEGRLQAASDGTCLSWTGVSFSVLRRLRSSMGRLGVALIDSSNNFMRDVRATNHVGLDGSGVGLYLDATSTANNISRVEVRDNDRGVVFDGASGNRLSAVVALRNRFGLALDSASANRVTDIRASNNFCGIYLKTAVDNLLWRLILDNNDNGLCVEGSSNVVVQVTAVGNRYGLNLRQAQKNTFVHLTAAYNSDSGILVEQGSDNNLLAQVSVFNNREGIQLAGVSGNRIHGLTATHNTSGIVSTLASATVFSGPLQVGNNSLRNCYIDGGIDPGLDDDDDASDGAQDNVHDGLCTTQGGSTFGTADTTASLAASLVGELEVEDDANQSDTAGVADFPLDPAAFDWLRFADRSRAWGKAPTTVRSDDRGRWLTGRGAIADWSLRANDTVVRNLMPLPDGNKTFSHSWSSGATTVFLRYATELPGMAGGNNNLLCETGEGCLVGRNGASYQGHGSLVEGPAFAKGTLSVIRLQRYQTNGR